MNLATLETTIGNDLHKAAAIFTTIKTYADEVALDATKYGPFIGRVLSLIPGASAGAAAEPVIVDLINALDAAIDAVEPAADGSVTVSFPGELVAAFKAVKASVTTDITALKAL